MGLMSCVMRPKLLVSGVTCHVSVWHVSCVICHVLCVRNHWYLVPSVICQFSTCRVSAVMGLMSCVMRPKLSVSGVKCHGSVWHVSCVFCHVSYVVWHLSETMSIWCQVSSVCKLMPNIPKSGDICYRTRYHCC